VQGLYQPDIAKLVGVRRIIQEERGSLPFRFTKENRDLTNVEVNRLTMGEAIEELNTATEEMIRLDPVRYEAIIEFIEERMENAQDDG
jgi:hypothetical protein